MRGKPVRVAIWPAGDYTTASTRYRVLELLPYLDPGKIKTILIKGGRTTALRALFGLGASLISDCLFIQKKLFPPAFLALLRRASSTIIYDVDDALYTQQSNPTPEEYRAGLMVKNRFDAMVRAADLIICGNQYLSDHLREYGKRTSIIPTSYYANEVPQIIHDQKQIVVIGWVGSKGTLIYLDIIAPVLKRLDKAGRKILLHVISNDEYHYDGLGHVIVNIPWSVETEWEEILKFDIGIMPLYDDEWSRGKCAFKAIQMMAFGIPIVASPVGANCEVIQHGKNGYLAKNEHEWEIAITELMESVALRRQMGAEARRTVNSNYPLQNAGNALQKALLENCDRR
jgi:glycosyltransferase involved in cell wall biosynthesis